MDALRRQDGFTLVEVLIVSVLMLIVLGATLAALTSFQRNISVNEKQNQAQDAARGAMDLMARDLRNLASPTREEPLALDLNAPQDIVFQSEGRTKDPTSLNVSNTTRVRYCLSPDEKLYRQVQTWLTATFPPIPSTATCPGPTGSGTGQFLTTTVVADHVTNGAARTLFTYNATDPRDVTEVTASLFIDARPGLPPAETVLQSSVYLRNQNRKPTAVFSIALANSGTAIIMNASESSDPEEKPLTFRWYLDGAELIGDGANNVVHTEQVTAGTHTVAVNVSDGPLDDDANPQTICVPSPAQGVTCTP